MNALSLFSGIGGMDLAAKEAGIKIAAMCEIEPFCRAVLQKHWPDVPIFEDIKTLRGETIGAPIDIIFGGPPCQPVSVAGRRRGQSDERYLWREVYRIVADLMPRFLVLENVSGILSIAGDEICSTLDSLGYQVGICQFEAAAVGAPHRRMRVFFVGYAEYYGLPTSAFPGSPYEGEVRGEEGAFHAGQLAGAGGRRDGNALAHPGRRVRERGAVGGAFCGERERRAAPDAERSGSPSFPYTESDGQRQGAEIGGWGGEGDEPGAWNRPAGPRADFPDAHREGLQGAERTPDGFADGSGGFTANPDMQRREEQQSPVTAPGKWEAFRSTECCGRRSIESRVGGVASGTPAWLDGRIWWEREPNIPRIAKGVKNRVARLRALGNCVVPAQVYPIFHAIVEAAKESYAIE